MFSLTFGGNPEAAKKHIAKYLRTIYGTRTVKHVYLSATAAECVRRVRTRERTATLFTKEAPAAILEGLRSYRFSILLDVLMAANKANVCSIDAEQPFESVSADLRHLITPSTVRS
jgi:thymidylate kinase